MTLIKREYESGVRWFINTTTCTILNCSKKHEIPLWDKDLTAFMNNTDLANLEDEEIKDLFYHSKGDDIPRDIARPSYENVSKTRNEYKAVLDLYKEDATRETFYLKICSSPYEALVHATNTYHDIVENSLTELTVIRKKRGTHEYISKTRKISEDCLIIQEQKKNIPVIEQTTFDDYLIERDKELERRDAIIEEQEQIIEWYRMKEHINFCTCPDCGSEELRMYSQNKGKYFVGCSSGKHHTIKPYNKLAKFCYEEGFLRDLWEENNEH